MCAARAHTECMKAKGSILRMESLLAFQGKCSGRVQAAGLTVASAGRGPLLKNENTVMDK